MIYWRQKNGKQFDKGKENKNSKQKINLIGVDDGVRWNIHYNWEYSIAVHTKHN
jgi:hypothetical protein